MIRTVMALLFVGHGALQAAESVALGKESLGALMARVDGELKTVVAGLHKRDSSEVYVWFVSSLHSPIHTTAALTTELDKHPAKRKLVKKLACDVASYYLQDVYRHKSFQAWINATLVSKNYGDDDPYRLSRQGLLNLKEELPDMLSTTLTENFVAAITAHRKATTFLVNKLHVQSFSVTLFAKKPVVITINSLQGR